MVGKVYVAWGRRRLKGMGRLSLLAHHQRQVDLVKVVELVGAQVVEGGHRAGDAVQVAVYAGIYPSIDRCRSRAEMII